jgi:hypothetical protein
LPLFCGSCGQPFPWTTRKIEALTEIVDLLDNLSDEEREKLKASIPDIIAETPKTEPAVLRFKKAAIKVGETGGNLLLKVLESVATDLAKRLMGIK